MYTKVFIESFWMRVKIGRLDECWLWTSGTYSTGYGRFWVGKRPDRRRRGAHILAFEIFHNRTVQVGLCICHACDVPLCCNPLHLWEGTDEQNFADMRTKQRHRIPISAEAHAPIPLAKRIQTYKKIHHQQEHRNSQFGKIWIMHSTLKESIKIFPDELDAKMVEGWTIGRKIHW